MDKNFRVAIKGIDLKWGAPTQAGRVFTWNSYHPIFTICSPWAGMDARLIDEQWYWVVACPECLGEIPEWTYQKCDEHDVCINCGTQRKQLKEIPRGTSKGIECKPCYAARHETEKEKALEAFKAAEYDEFDFLMTDKIVCPHCALSYEAECDERTGKLICERCDGEYTLEIEYSISYSTTKV